MLTTSGTGNSSPMQQSCPGRSGTTACSGHRPTKAGESSEHQLWEGWDMGGSGGHLSSLTPSPLSITSCFGAEAPETQGVGPETQGRQCPPPHTPPGPGNIQAGEALSDHQEHPPATHKPSRGVFPAGFPLEVMSPQPTSPWRPVRRWPVHAAAPPPGAPAPPPAGPHLPRSCAVR